MLALVSGGFEEARASMLLAEAERCVDCSLLLHEAGRAIAEDGTDGSHTLPWLDGAGVLRVGGIVAGRFRVLRLLGRGGMGEVYEALDNELGELVALKTIRTSDATRTSSIERFRQEVRLARRVVHPHVCRVLEFGRHQVEGAEPVYFLTMELLRGELLSRHLRQRGRLSPLESVAIARQICAGLSAIHAQGVLHRDIKPSNVMLCSAEGEVDATGIAPRRAVLLDFGVARSLALETTARSHGALIGTPDYMAPEQLQAQALTPATDIYALGMVLFELLAGELPFAADPTLTRALKRLQGSPPLAGANAAEAPPKLARLVARCLEVAPSARPPSAAELLQELSELERELSPSPEPGRLLPVAGDRGTIAWVRAKWFIACAIFAVVAVSIAMSSRITRPSTTVASALPSHHPSRPAPPPASTNASPPMPSSREPTLGAAAAAARNEQHVTPPAPRGASEPSQRPSKASSSASASDRARPTTGRERSCAPPYYFDEDGFRVYRKECL